MSIEVSKTITNLRIDDMVGELSPDVVVELLLLAEKGWFHPEIARRPSASPIFENVPIFYVVPKADGNITNPPGESFRVKYNNCARSKVRWFPYLGNLIGIVIRVMSMSTRTEPSSNDKRVQHGFRGHWISLVRRPDDSKLKDKAEIRQFVQEASPGLVQIWPVDEKGNITSALNTRSSNLSAPLNHTVSTIELSDMLLNSQASGSDPDLRRGLSKQFSFKSLGLESLSLRELSLRGLSLRDLGAQLSSRSLDPDLIPKEGEEQLWRFFPSVDNIEIENDGTETFEEPDLHTKLKLEELSLSNGEEASQPRSKLVKSHSLRLPSSDETDDDDTTITGVEGDKYSKMTFEWFKTACSNLNGDEFTVWYHRHVSKIFDQDTSRELGKLMINKDPRIDPNWIFMEKSEFDISRPIGNVWFEGTYGTGVKIVQRDENLLSLVEFDPMKMGNNQYDNFYACLLDSQITDLFAHTLYKLRVGDGTLSAYDYWHQTILKTPTGKRMVTRIHCVWYEPTKMHAEMQDVSHLFQDLMALPPLPY